MEATVADAVVGNVTNHLVDSIWRQIGYVWNYSSNLQGLKAKVERLKAEKESVLRQVTDARDRGEEIEEIVQIWLTSADEALEAADTILEEDNDRASKKCFIGCNPSWKTRYLLSRKAIKEALPAVNEVRGEEKFDRISHRIPVQKLELAKDYEAFQSREQVLNKILEAMKDPDVKLIGAYGLGGVGKTTLVKQVTARVKEDGTYRVVARANVNQNPNLNNIQQEIADWLGFPLDVESAEVRATQLRARLKQEEKVLVILDDVWGKINLEEIGIPNDHQGCKLLMTSRDLNVLLKMDVQERSSFRLDVLQHEEAWQLFEEKAGDLKDPSLQPIAIEVARRCAGLPILIVAVASALRNKDSCEWIDALEELKSPDNEGLEAQCFKALELTYNILVAEAKSLFLLCGQLRPHYISILDLLKYSVGLGLFNKRSTVKAARNRLLRMVNDLKRSCLLLEGDDEDEVKMHDVVHSHAAFVGCRYHHFFSVAYGTVLEKWPEKEIFEQCTAISLPYCKTIPELPEVFECPNLHSFRLYNKDSSLKIPDNLFSRMKKLKLLDLSEVHLSPLPLSLRLLKNLQTLCLDRCVLGDIAAIGELNKLQVLSLIGSNIVRLPREIEKLTCLQILDLSRCERLEVIPPDVLSCLTKLEELYMGNSFVQWEREEHGSERKNANLAELRHLSNLVTLDLQITKAEMLSKDLFSEKLERYRVFIGEEWDWSDNYETSKTMKLKLNSSFELEKVKALLMRSEDLYLDDLEGVKAVLFELDGGGFPNLKHLQARNSHYVQYIVDRSRTGNLIAFPKLESLIVENLSNLKKICYDRLMVGSFSKLRQLKVTNCNTLKNIFCWLMFRDLPQLEEIHINTCANLEEIISEAEGVKDQVTKLTQLRVLTLEYLPKFTGFCSQLKVPAISQNSQRLANANADYGVESETKMLIFGHKIQFPNLIDLKLTSVNVEKIWSHHLTGESLCTQNLTSLTVEGCGNLSYLFTSSMVKYVAQLRKLEIRDCNFIGEIIVANAEESMMNIFFPKLESLKLKTLPVFIGFCTANLIECPSLKILQLENCPRQHTFISSPKIKNVQLTNRQESLSLFDEKVAFPNLEELHLIKMHKLKMIWNDDEENLQTNSFSKLKVVRVEHADALLKFFSSEMLKRRLQNVEEVIVKNCNLLEEVFDLRALVRVERTIQVGAASQLRTLKIDGLPNLKHVWNGDPNGIISFYNLRQVYAWHCPSLECLFPFSMAHRGLPQLEQINIGKCGLDEIVAKEAQIEEETPMFEFPRLKSFYVWRLERLKYFYSEIHTLECPVLECFIVHECEKLKIFSLEPQVLQGVEKLKPESPQKSEVAQPSFSFRKIIRNLEELGLNYKDIQMIQESQFEADSFHKLKILQPRSFDEDSVNFLFDFLQKFKKLENLVLRKCNFKVLLPYGIVGETLAQIQLLKLDDLPNMRHIWSQDCQPAQVLPNLQSLILWKCHGLVNMGPSFASYQNLTTLDVWMSNGLVNLVSSSTAKSMVNITNMTIRECNMLTEIVADEGDESQSQTEIIFYKLVSLKLHCLRSLTSFTSSACRIVKFPSLEVAIVTECPRMKIFSMAVSAPKLKRVYVNEEREKQRWIGDLNNTIKQLYKEMIGFNGLQDLKLSEFPQLKEVWYGQLPVNFFNNLRRLMVDECKHSTFSIPSNLLPFLNNLEELEVRNCDSVEQVLGLMEHQRAIGVSRYLSKLSKLHLVDLPRLRLLWNEVPKQSFEFKNLKILEVHSCGRLRSIFTHTICFGLLRLQELAVRSCDMLEEIITQGPAEEETTEEIILPLLNSISLESLPNLTNFYSGTGNVQCPSLKEMIISDCPTTFTCTFLGAKAEPNATHRIIEPKIVFPNLQDLKLSAVKIAQIWNDGHLPLPSYFQNLTSLNVDNCCNLKHLLSSSMVKGVVHLKKLEICDCEMMEEIIVCEGLGKENEVLLGELDFLKLKNLPKVARFCTCKLIECPALKELFIQDCPELGTFVCNPENVNVADRGDLETMNSTLFDEKVACPNLEKMQILKMDKLKMIWDNGIRLDSFCKLKELTVKDGKGLLNVFPSRMLGELQNLEYLCVKNCDSIEEVFDIQELVAANLNESDNVAIIASQLRTLAIDNLPNLKHIWNKDPLGTLSFHNLCEMYVENCSNLKYVFPASIAEEGFPKLEILQCYHCGMENVVAKKESMEATPKFVFPKLKSLVLSELGNIKSFYSGIHILESPILECLRVFDCINLETFAMEPQNLHQVHMDIEIQYQPLFSFDKVLTKLKVLTLRSKDIPMVQLQGPFHAIKELELQYFHDKHFSSSSPFDILPEFSNVETLVLNSCDFEELFSNELVTEEKHARSLAQIRTLKLHRFPYLRLICNQKSQLEHVLQNIEGLEVYCCHGLVYLVPSFVSFSNLTALKVWECDGMEKLVTSRTAKSMVHLAKMAVQNCKMLREIIANEEDKAQTEITFNKLESLTLDCLTSLTIFSSATCTIKCPSLEQVIVIRCPKMKVFSQEVVCAPELQRVYLTKEMDKWSWTKDLNTTLQQLHTEMNKQASEDE